MARTIIAIVGGFVCALIAKGGKAPLVLAVVVFVLGLVFAVPAVVANRASTNLARTGTVTLTEAIRKRESRYGCRFLLR